MTKPVASVFKGKPRSATSGNLQVCNLESQIEKKKVEGVSVWGLQVELLQRGGDGLCSVTFLRGGLGLFEGR